MTLLQKGSDRESIRHKRMTPENSKITKKVLKFRPRVPTRAGGTHLVLHPGSNAMMSKRLRQILAWWFVLQIVLPFTAPLQTLDVLDLFGTKSQHATTSSPESTTTPTMRDASTTLSIVSDLAPSALRDDAPATATLDTSARVSLVSARLLPAPQVQRSVLRL
jgi:hypothetical protein